MAINFKNTTYWDYGIIELKTKLKGKPIRFAGFANKDRTRFVREDPLSVVKAKDVKRFY